MSGVVWAHYLRRWPPRHLLHSVQAIKTTKLKSVLIKTQEIEKLTFGRPVSFGPFIISSSHGDTAYK